MECEAANFGQAARVPTEGAAAPVCFSRKDESWKPNELHARQYALKEKGLTQNASHRGDDDARPTTNKR